MKTNLQTVTSSASTLQAIRKGLNESFKERSGLVDGMLTALLSRQMLFLLGPPGTAKSDICSALCSAISGNYFNWLVSKFTTPEEVFGPLSLKGLENDKYERVTTGKLPVADVAFLDEIFKGSSAILNTLLPVINERTFYNGTNPTKIPLQVLFGASNEIPEAQELEALYDRFVLRYNVDRMQSDQSFSALIGATRQPIPTISLAELAVEQANAKKVVVTDAIIKVLVEMRREVDKQGIYVSDRKWLQAVEVVKAFAYLNGHSEVEEGDLEILENVLWRTPDQQKDVKRIIQRLSNPLGDKIVTLTDAVAEIMEQRAKKTIQPVEAQKKVKDAIKRLQALGDPSTNAKLAEAIKKVQAANMDILKNDLGLE